MVILPIQTLQLVVLGVVQELTLVLVELLIVARMVVNSMEEVPLVEAVVVADSSAVVAVETPVKLVVVQVEHHIIKLLNLLHHNLWDIIQDLFQTQLMEFLGIQVQIQAHMDMREIGQTP